MCVLAPSVDRPGERSRGDLLCSCLFYRNKIELGYSIIMLDEMLRKELERLEAIKDDSKKKLTKKEKLVISKSIKVIKILLEV